MKFFQGMALPADLFARVLRRLQTLKARARHRLGLPAEAVLGKVEISPHFRHPIDASQRAILTARYWDLFPDIARTELDEARRLAAHHFTFLGYKIDHGERIAWFLDPVSGRDWPRIFSPDIPYRGSERLGDIKLPWELNKHQYFFTLGKATWLEDNPAFAIEIVRQIDHWIQDNPQDCGINWISALEVGTRAVSWIMAFPFYVDQCDVDFRCRLAKSLAQHMLFVEQHLSVGRFANTHLIGEAAALVAGGLFLDSQHSLRWLNRGLALLEQEIGRQVTFDGVHTERSIAYHRFFLDHYYLVSSLLSANDQPLSVGVLTEMERLTTFLMDILFPNGTAPAFGDCDDARGFFFHTNCLSDYRSHLALGAVFFERGDFKAAAGSLSEEVLWLLGIEGATKFQVLMPQQPDHNSVAYPDAGYYAMRGGWGFYDPLLVFDCGALGFGPAGHGHADALSFQLYVGGYSFLVDSGTYSYNLDYQWRDAFRSTRAHNTVVVDGQDQSVPHDRMSWRSMATTRCHRWLSTKWFDIVDGEHDGYQRLSNPVLCRRVIFFLKPDTWLIWDQLRGDGRHGLEMFMHLKPDCSVEMKKIGAKITFLSPEGVRLNAWIQTGDNKAILPEVLIGSEKERAAWFSPCYGIRVPAKALRIQHEFTDQIDLVTCLSTSNVPSPILLEQHKSIQVVVRREEWIKEIFFYRFNESWPSGVDGIHFDGQILYLRSMVKGDFQILQASDFCELSIANLLDVRSATLIESIVLENSCCEVVLPPEYATDLRISAKHGIQLIINGNPASIPIASNNFHSIKVIS